jgi:hypothetical protein
MKLEDIIASWEADNTFDHERLTEESVKSVTLHSKYYALLVNEKMKLVDYNNKKKELLHLKTEYYNGDLDQETLKENGWKPFSKKLLKLDIDRYIQADKDYINMNLKIALQEEKVIMLKEIIDNLNRRSFTIKNIIEWKKFKAGEY